MGATIALPNSTVTKVLTRQRNCKLVWFQNFNTGTGVYVKGIQQFTNMPAPTFTTSELYITPANDATHPGYLILDTPGLVDYDWFAYQNSGGQVNLVCGQEFGGIPGDTGVTGP